MASQYPLKQHYQHLTRTLMPVLVKNIISISADQIAAATFQR